MNQKPTPAERVLLEVNLVDHPELFRRCYQALNDFRTQRHVNSGPKFLIVGSLAFEAIAYRYLKLSPLNQVSDLIHAGMFGIEFRECQLVVDPNLPTDYVNAVGTPMQSIREVVIRQSSET